MNKEHRPGAAALKFFYLAIGSWLAVFIAAACRNGRPVHEPAALILESASVVTMNPAEPRAEAVAIAGGKIVSVGTAAGARAFKGKETRLVDLPGTMILPGFQDSHIHLVSGGMELAECDLNGLRTREEIFAKIKTYAAGNPQKAWIVGGGWDLPIFPGADPDKADLDRLVSDRPAFLSAADGHSAWVNSRALEIAGITARTPDPEDGRIERKPGTREPSGTLREAAQRLVSRHIPEPGAQEYSDGLRRGLALANRAGITSIIEANASDEILEAYRALDRAGELTVRVLASIHVDPKKGIGQVPELIRKRETFAGPHLKSTAVKIFVDGVIESHTAALLAPYLDRPGDRGRPLLEQAEFDRLAEALEKAGFQIHVHAIGDRAVRMSLDAFAAARQANGDLDLRHHIAHLELIDPADVPRFKGLGITANFQALWAYPDLYITQLTEPILGPERSSRLYPVGSVFRSGAVIVGGSDWSVSSLNPLEAIQVAVTRRSPEDKAGAPWLPGECIDLRTALAAYTVNGAYLCHREAEAGSIETGKAADLVVLDRDLLAISPFDIHNARVLLTLLEGKAVYRDPALAARLN
jgi:predicted amidohydrolase YtcJ